MLYNMIVYTIPCYDIVLDYDIVQTRVPVDRQVRTRDERAELPRNAGVERRERRKTFDF